MIALEPIGVVRSPWPEKFAIPRQSGLADSVESIIELDRARVPAEALRGLEDVSHLWLLTWFHALTDAGQGWRPTVRPPRLGGATRLGVFATRSPHRPNPIALTLVALHTVTDRRLHVTGADLLDGTPVLDIKPYLPWADSQPDARCGWAPAPPTALAVHLAPTVTEALQAHPRGEELAALIEASLRFDPRPAHQRGDPERHYSAAIADVDVRFVVVDGVVQVLGLSQISR